jgi:outer membrane protein TolC
MDGASSRTARRRRRTAAEEWTRLSTRVDVVRAYYGAVLAGERVTALRAAAAPRTRTSRKPRQW